jgi:hypothetical protein
MLLFGPIGHKLQFCHGLWANCAFLERRFGDSLKISDAAPSAVAMPGGTIYGAVSSCRSLILSAAGEVRTTISHIPAQKFAAPFKVCLCFFD